jgi:hypothetical protein
MPFCSSTGRMAHDEQARRARQHHADLPASRAPNRSRTPGQYLRQNWLSTGSEWSSQSISRLVRRRPPEAGEAKPLFADLGELPFGFRRLRPGELEKMRCGNQTATRREAPPLGSEIDNWRSFRLRRREAPAQHSKLVRAILKATNDGTWIGRPDVVTRLQVWRSCRPFHSDAVLTERSEVVAIRDMIAVVVAHGRRHSFSRAQSLERAGFVVMKRPREIGARTAAGPLLRAWRRC